MDLMDRIVHILIDEGVLKGFCIIPNKIPTHGSCCTCQTCGQSYDECVITINYYKNYWI
jgi:hypothetical protein